MEKYYSKIDPSLLLHIVHRVDDFNGKERSDVVPNQEFIQMAALNLPKGRTFKPHKHIYKDVESILPQESWTILKGKVKAIFYDIDDTIIAEPILNAGDCSISLRGGHNYLMLEPSIIREFKVGPYRGQEQDKVFIE